MKGWKTVALGLAVALAPEALNYLAGIDWQALGLSPAAAGVIGAAIIGLRAATSTPIGKSS